MKITVTTPTGNIGGALAGLLLDEGATLTLLARDPSKLKDLSDRGANVLQGDVTDPGSVVRAFEGQDAVFTLTPPDYSTDDLRAHQRRVGRVYASAVREAGVPRVVNLSSVGAHLPEGTGPIKGLHDVEGELNGTDAAIRHLRAAYFMENFLMAMETMKTAGTIFMPIRGEVRMPMVATRDIAAVAAKHLLDGDWSGKEAVGVHGPADLSHDEAAKEISEGTGREIGFQQVPPAAVKEAMMGMGLRESTVDLFLEMYAAMDAGMDVAEPRTPETTTPTTLREFAAQVIRPALG